MSENTSLNRRLAAILAADVVGYSSLIENDEAGTLDRLKSRRKTVLDPLLQRYGGRIVKLMGDGVLVEFGSAVNAVRFGLDMQQDMARENLAEAALAPIVLRVGINVGDVVVEGGDLYGDGVIVAARLESLAEPGAIYASGKVHEELRGKISVDFADLGEFVLKNIERPVRVFRLGRAGSTASPGPRLGVKPTSAPSLAILPFKNLDKEPADQRLADGMTEDVLTELSRFRHIRVVARHASLDDLAKGGNQRLAAEIGADYYAHGTVRNQGDHYRITIQLVQSLTGDRLWSQKFDVGASAIDQVTGAIVASLEEKMVSIAANMARMRPASDWTAGDYLLLGRELCNAYNEPSAIPLFKKAVEIDPNFASAHAWLSLASIVTFTTNAQLSYLHAGRDHAMIALRLDSNDPTVHHANGMAHIWLRELERAGHHFDRAVALNPADMQIRADRCNCLRFSGRLGEALSAMDSILDRYVASPPWFWAVRGEILFDMKRYAEAIASFGNVPEKTHRRMYVAASHAYLGDLARAQSESDSLRALGPIFDIEQLRLIKPHAIESAFDHLIEGLKLAGLMN